MDKGCGSGSCGCAGGGASTATLPDPIGFQPVASVCARPTATVNGIALHPDGQTTGDDTLRQLACAELLRQAAQQAGLLAADDAPSTDGSQTEAATAAIEALLERELVVPEPSDEACRRYHDAHAAAYSSDERLSARHILFAVTPGVDVVALRQKAERVLLDVRCYEGDKAKAQAAFAQAASQWSNCPSSAEGGDLGWLTRQDCAPEFARELFGLKDMGVLPRLVHSRFGLHVVEITAREPGTPRPFETVRDAVRLALQQQTWATALRQYLLVLAGQARVTGVPLEGSDTPLVQ
ncbi:MAG: peptidylprolyl isomerase [Comamonadaceae bacterium]|nr:MAG: peptidylprolyl isomerase [Comamonadaceae bacterium]